MARNRNTVEQVARNQAAGKPDNYMMPWSLDELVIVANTLPTVNNRELLANTLHRTEGSIDYVWYDLYRSRKSWRMDFPDEFPDYVKNVLKARKIVGLTRVFTPIK